MAKKTARRRTTKKKKTTRRKTTRKSTRGRKKKAAGDLIISKSRTKAAASINVSGDFYSALDEAVRTIIAGAEERAINNNRRTLRPHDL